MSITFAARAALRVLPFVQEALRHKPNNIALRVFGNLAFAWFAARYAILPEGIRPPTIDVGHFGLASSAATSAGMAAHTAVVTVFKPSLAAAEVFNCAHDAFDSSKTANSSTASFAAAARTMFWSAVSIDATRVETGAEASVIAGSLLWPHRIQPELLQSLWQEMQQALLAANENWHVWINWYSDRLEGRVGGEESELAFVRVEGALWDQGPAIVNAEIIRLVEKTENIPADNPPFTLNTLTLNEARTAISSARSPPSVERTPPLEAVPEQEPLATKFGVNSQGLIDVVPDPPAHGTAADALQMEYYDEMRLKAQALSELGQNQLGELSGPVNRFREGLKDRIEDISIASMWSRGNTLRSRLKAHDLSMNSVEPDLAWLPPLVAETLRDLVHTYNVFIVGDPKGRELDEIRLGPHDVEAAKRVMAAAGPIIEALQHSENVATPEAIEAVAEQAETAEMASPGVDGDQAIGLARKTTGNIVSEILRRAYALLRNEPAIALKEIRVGVYHKAADAALMAGAGAVALYWPTLVSFVARNADALRAYVEANWHNPTLIEIISAIVRTCSGF